MVAYSIYIVDDDPVVNQGLSFALQNDYKVESFFSAEEAIAAVEKNIPEIMLLDIGLAGMNGIEALEIVKKKCSETKVIMITAFEDVKTVVSAMKLGAYDYIVKPVRVEALQVVLRNACETFALRKKINELQKCHLIENSPGFIGRSKTFQRVIDIVQKAAKSQDTSILIIGETGTGKELIAKSVHYSSPNSDGPMITVNCAAIPKELIESELFGYEKGAFSGANKVGKTGLVEQAANGTLFLDEIGDLSMEAQAKVLRFLEEGEYYRVGGTKKRSITTRVVSATNKDLQDMIRTGDFRADLYFRLAVVKINVPSLMERKNDIIHIAKHYLAEFNQKFRKNFRGFSEGAEIALKNYNWTGNVRELKNMIEKSVLLSDGDEMTLRDLGLELTGHEKSERANNSDQKLPTVSPSGIDFRSIIKGIEKEYLEDAFNLANGNESKAAKFLKISRDSYRYRKKRLEAPL